MGQILLLDHELPTASPLRDTRGLAVGSSWSHWENKAIMCILFGHIELGDLYRRSKFNSN